MRTDGSDGDGAASSQAAARGTASTERPLAGRRILFAEDEALIAIDVAWSLEDAGALVVGPLSTFAETRAAAEDGSFDAAILDVDLQGQLVFPVADLLRDRGAPFVLATGNGLQYDLERRYPGVPVVHKPYSPEQLIEEVICALMAKRA